MNCEEDWNSKDIIGITFKFVGDASERRRAVCSLSVLYKCTGRAGKSLPNTDLTHSPLDSARCAQSLRALAANAAGELDILGHDRDALCVDRTQVGVLEEADKISLRSLL